MTRIRFRLAPLVLAVATSTALVPHTAPASGPRPLSEAERVAVELAAAYLSEGPPAFSRALSRHSSFLRFPKDQLAAELEVRAGPPAGARWELRTVSASLPPGTVVFSVQSASGLDQDVRLDLVPEAGGWALRAVRNLAEPTPPRAAIAPAAALVPADRYALALAASAIAAATLFLFLAVAARRKRWTFAISLAGTVASLALLGIVLHRLGRTSGGPSAAPKGSGPGPVSLSALLPLRQRLETTSSFDPQRDIAPFSGSPAADMARLWLAQKAIQGAALPAGKSLLLASSSRAPWANVLFARAALLEGKEVEAALAYERAAKAGPVHDGLLLEAGQAFSFLGFAPQAEGYIAQLTELGSRSADAYYLRAAQEAEAHRLLEAETAFVQGWQLRPLGRRELFQVSGVWELLRKPAVYSLLKLESPLEPTVEAPPVGSLSPVKLPADAEARRTGSLLLVSIGEAELVVPGGVGLVPDALLEDAGAEDRREEARALARLKSLLDSPPPAGALSQPALRRQVMGTARALARRHRWREIATLTSGLAGGDDGVPTELIVLRVEALRRTNRTERAHDLLKELARSPTLIRRNEPARLVQLAEFHAVFGEFDEAVRFLKQAAARVPGVSFDDRVRQLMMEQRLASSYTPLTTPYFEIRYPPDRREAFPKHVARILEAERVRLGKLIPGFSTRPVTVQLLFFDEFRQTFALGSDVIGLYDGKIRVPLASVTRFPPPVVALITHELAHALLADATEDHAPHWFQEGLAQHAEMRPFRPNHLGFYAEKGLLLSIPALEEVLSAMPDYELVEAAYHEADWLVYFIESRWGLPAIHRLVEAYRDGLTTDEAIEKALGISVVTLSEQFATWSRDGAPKMITSRVIKYEMPEENGIQTAVPAPASVEEPERKPREVPDSLKSSPLRRGGG